MCPLKHHVVQKIINDCCTTRVCECDACVDPTPCEDGWDTINEKIDVCGCKTHQCKPPSVCLIDGVEHAPGKTKFNVIILVYVLCCLFDFIKVLTGSVISWFVNS